MRPTPLSRSLSRASSNASIRSTTSTRGRSRSRARQAAESRPTRLPTSSRASPRRGASRASACSLRSGRGSSFSSNGRDSQASICEVEEPPNYASITTAEKLVCGNAHLCRGEDIWRAIEWDEFTKQEQAKQRRAASLKAGSRERELVKHRSREMQRRALIKVELERIALIAAATRAASKAAGADASGAGSDSESPQRRRRLSLQEYMDRAEAQPEGILAGGNPAGEGHLIQFHSVPRIVKRLKKLSKRAKLRRQTERERRLKDDFLRLSSEEQASYSKAYEEGMGDDELNHKGDAEKLCGALNSLGLVKNDAERRELLALCTDESATEPVGLYWFALVLVPKARDIIQMIQRPRLEAEFDIYDTDHSGSLDETECLQILEKRCRSGIDHEGLEQMKAECREIFKQCARTRGKLFFDGFEVLIGKMREAYQRIKNERTLAITTAESLTEEDIFASNDELLSMHDSFIRQDVDGNGTLDAKEVCSALLEYGLLPRKHEEKLRIMDFVEMRIQASKSEAMDFKGFIQLIHTIRADCQKRSGKDPDVRKQFLRFDRDGNNFITFSEASVLFVELGLAPRCSQDRDTIEKLFQKVDVDHSGTLNYEEFQHLMQLISERLRAEERSREHLSAQMLKFSMEEVLELRKTFYELDVHEEGLIGIQKCREMATKLKRTMTGDEMRELYNSVDLSNNGLISFEEFLFFVKVIQHPIFPLKDVIQERARALSTFLQAW